jgi:excisionase family DNA binding protein
VEKSELEALAREVRERLSRLEERLKPEPRCYKLPDAAEQLGVSITTLREMLERGEIRSSTVGRRQMISRSELDRVSAPDVERPKVVATQRVKAWVPIEKPKKR